MISDLYLKTSVYVSKPLILLEEKLFFICPAFADECMGVGKAKTATFTMTGIRTCPDGKLPVQTDGITGKDAKGGIYGKDYQYAGSTAEGFRACRGKEAEGAVYHKPRVRRSSDDGGRVLPADRTAHRGTVWQMA
jgi:hypothetical protein